MIEPIRFIPRASLAAQTNLAEFVELVRLRFTPMHACNRFEDYAWSVQGLASNGSSQQFVYFSQLGVEPKKHYKDRKRVKGRPADIPRELQLREPFDIFAKAMFIYLHAWETSTGIVERIAALRLLEAALYEVGGSTCPTTTTPEVLNRACALAVTVAKLGESAAYARGKQLELIYRYMVELGLVTVPSEWVCSLRRPQYTRNRVGKQFEVERQKKLPSPQALEALATIFNSDSSNPREIFASSACALMLCDPDRSVEVLFAPMDVLAPDWTDPVTGEVGTCLRWYPAKGAAPMTKTVIPSMRDIAVRAVERLLQLSAPARKLACWYEQHPDRIYLPAHLEYLRKQERLNLNEIHAVLFTGQVTEHSKIETNRTHAWLKAMAVPRVFKRGVVFSVPFSDLEKAVLAKLPQGFPLMDAAAGMQYSEALCLARLGEFDSKTPLPCQCCFDRIKYSFFQGALKTRGDAKSIFEKLGYQDERGEFLSLTTHMLRHYLNTLARQSGLLTEEEIALWSGRKLLSQNATYNHQSDRDVIAKLRDALGEPTKSVGPFANIDNRIFIRRDEFASIKVITAHITEFGYCVHDYAQSPCQVHQDCMNCNEQVCVKGDARAEIHLRKTRADLMRLQAEASIALSEEVLGAAEWFDCQSRTLERVSQLIAILDDPVVPQGAIIQLNGVVPPSRLAMAEESRRLLTKPVSQAITTLDDVHALLTDAAGMTKELTNAR